MNAFCVTLPLELLCLELTGFINDPRLLDFFAICKKCRSTIMDGDPENLNIPQTASHKKVTLHIPSQTESLLVIEKQRFRNQTLPLFNEDNTLQATTLSATVIGEYFRHKQCDRWLGLQFYHNAKQQKKYSDSNLDNVSAQRIAKGLAFEEAIESHLQSGKKIIRSIPAKDGFGRVRPLSERFTETTGCFDLLRKEGSENYNHNYLVQPVLHLDSEILIPQQRPLTAVGIPDLLQIHAKTKSNTILLQVGDIKSSSKPRYYQKWQVAFSAWLLQKFFAHQQQSQTVQCVAADTGFILTPSGDSTLAERHVFNLRPYLASMPALIKKIQNVFNSSSRQHFWQMQKQCLGCAGFDYCYQQAVCEEEIQLIPGIRRGDLEKMRFLGMGKLQDTHEKKTLQAAMISLQKNCIIIEDKSRRTNKSDLFPANISTIFVIHTNTEPVFGQLQSIEMFVCNKNQNPEKLQWTMDAESSPWKNFSRDLLQRWNTAITEKQGPHLLLFGQTTRMGLLNMAESLGDKQLVSLFTAGSACHYTDLQQLLGRNFSIPLPGTMTLYALNCVLGLMPENPFPKPESLLHEDRLTEIDVYTVCDFLLKLWQWTLFHVSGRYHKSDWCLQQQSNVDLSHTCLNLVEAEKEHQRRDMEALREMSLAERIERFRALGSLDFVGTCLDETGKFMYLLNRTPLAEEKNTKKLRNIPAKFRSGDFLRLVPFGVTDLQSGMPVIMAGFDSKSGEVSLYPRKRGVEVIKGVNYSLEEDSEDFHSAKVRDVVQNAFTRENEQLIELIGGTYTYKREQANTSEWLQTWLQTEAAAANLNTSQQQALKLPFTHPLSLISGPPGTGKTHLLGWIIIALIRQAQQQGTPLCIAVSALTHKAIDQVLQKLANLVNYHSLPDFPVRCLKLGRWEGEPFDPDDAKMQVEPCKNDDDTMNSSYSVIGATGYSLYSMLRKQGIGSSSVKPFDWVIFDEASQILLPQALLSLIHGKGNYLFLGDVCQLPPIVRSQANSLDAAEETVRSSVLELLLKHYPNQNQVLDTTYRMNDTICHFPSKTWYKNQLTPACEIAGNRLQLKPSNKNDLIDTIIDADKPVVLVGIDHHDWNEAAEMEADLLAAISYRLQNSHGIETEQIAIISPHRAQNNSIVESLTDLLGHDDLPVIDTVERMQGAERDVILFGFACTEYDQMFSEFLNNPERFNVVLTRARKKVIVVGNKIFFNSIASTEKQLSDNACFKEFVEYCLLNDCYFF